MNVYLRVQMEETKAKLWEIFKPFVLVKKVLNSVNVVGFTHEYFKVGCYLFIVFFPQTELLKKTFVALPSLV